MTAPEVSGYLLSDAKRELLRCIAESQGANSSVDGLVGWLLPTERELRSLSDVAREASVQIRTERSFQLLAALGYARAGNCLIAEFDSVLSEEFERLLGREPFAGGNLMPFCTDVVSLLGLALAVSGIGDPGLKTRFQNWTRRFVPRCLAMAGTSDWQRCFYASAQLLVGEQSGAPVPANPDVADVRLALHATGAFAEAYKETDDDQLQTLRLLLNETSASLDAVRAALRLRALEWIRRSCPVVVPGRIDVAELGDLLRGVESGLRYWTWESSPRTGRTGAEARQWHVEHEYHVQNLLGFLLRPFLPDLVPEENLPSVAHKKPRVDLYVPSLKLIIEVKFVYAGQRFQKVIDEISSDTSLYLVDRARYEHIIVFVWDDSRRNTEHDFLRQGLLKLSGIRDVVVVSRPGHWQ